jgi:hypothetical protein
MDFNDNEVLLQTQRGSLAWAWNDFSSFLETPYFFHLYFNSRAFFLVPKDAFTDLESLQTPKSAEKLLKPRGLNMRPVFSRSLPKRILNDFSPLAVNIQW